MFRDVPACSGMFRNVPCSGFYRRPFLLGSLIKDVFERRRWTGSEVFSLLMHLDSTIFALLSYFPLKEAICPKCFGQTNCPRMSISGWRASFKTLFALAPYTVETQDERYQAILWKGKHRWWVFGNFRQHSSWNWRSWPSLFFFSFFFTLFLRVFIIFQNCVAKKFHS